MPMRVLGIDPGIAISGYAILEEKGRDDYTVVTSGTIRTASDLPPARRLAQLHDRILELIAASGPQVLVVEKIFFSKNVRTAFQVGEARGVIILAADRTDLEMFEYTPLQVKQAVAGYGRAEKAQVQKMVQMLLKLPHQPSVDDEADAMAVALCHLQARRWQEALRGGAKK